MAKKLLCAITLILALVCALASCGHEHEWSNNEIIKSPTCNEPGEEKWSCECGASEIRAVNASHNFVGERCSVCNAAKPTTDLEYISNGDGTCKVKVQYVVKDTVVSIEIPNLSPSGDRVTAIDEFGFSSCKALKSVIIPNSVTEIGKSAFFSVTTLEHLTLGNGITNFDCYNLGLEMCELKSVCIIDINHWMTHPSLEGARYMFDNTDLVDINGNVINELEIPNGISYIRAYAFSGLNISSVKIPTSVTKIGTYAFQNCSVLSNVIFENGVKTIEMGAFEDCTKLASLNLPNSVTSIGDHAFSGCNALTSVEIPVTVDSLGTSAFFGCENLAVVRISAKYIGQMAFKECRNLREVILTDSVKAINDDAFKNCVRLYTLYLGKGLTDISYGAFADCNNLTLQYYSGTKTEWSYIINHGHLSGSIVCEVPQPTYDISNRYN